MLAVSPKWLLPNAALIFPLACGSFDFRRKLFRSLADGSSGCRKCFRSLAEALIRGGTVSARTRIIVNSEYSIVDGYWSMVIPLLFLQLHIFLELFYFINSLNEGIKIAEMDICFPVFDGIKSGRPHINIPFFGNAF